MITELTAIVERSGNYYSIFTTEEFDSCFLMGYGYSIEEAKRDFWQSYKEMQSMGAQLPKLHVRFLTYLCGNKSLCYVRKKRNTKRKKRLGLTIKRYKLMEGIAIRDMRNRLKDIEGYVSWFWLSKDYVGMSIRQFYHKLDGKDGDGFTAEEAAKVKEGLLEVAEKIRICAERIK